MDDVNARVARFLKGRRAVVAALAAAAAAALLLVPAGASAASPVLEFVVPGNAFPVSFTTESGPITAEMAGLESLVHCTASTGEGKITGPRSTISEYRFTGCTTERGSHEPCKSAGAKAEEITTGPIEADLVYIDQAKHEVGMLLNPGGGTYMTFECGGISAEGQGPFLAPGSPINQEATSFTLTLNQFDSVQTPNAYENEKGEMLEAIPRGKKGSNKLVPTGVEAGFTVHTSVLVEVKAVTTQEIEAKQLDEEVKQLQASLKKQEEALKKAEEHDKQVGAENVQLVAAVKKDQEEVATAKKKLEELEKAKSHPPTNAQLAKALKQCKKQPKNKRAQCIVKAQKKYGHKAKTGKK
jgi:hypothetical protein